MEEWGGGEGGGGGGEGRGGEGREVGHGRGALFSAPIHIYARMNGRSGEKGRGGVEGQGGGGGSRPKVRGNSISKF